MTRTARWLLAAGLLLFLGLLVFHGIQSVLSALSVAGWGLLLLVPFHLLPVVVDALAMTVLFEPGTPGSSLRETSLSRWVGESVNSLMPAGQLGGPVLMARQLAQRGAPMPVAGAVVTVSTTYQLMAQMVFALGGLALLGRHQRSPILLIGIAVLCAIAINFYLAQRRGMFQKLANLARRFVGPERMASFTGQAESLDVHVRALYAQRRRGAWSFTWNLLGWLIGTGEVYLILRLMKVPVSWESALLLESLGQAVRCRVAIPGSLGVQEGGYLLLAPFAGLSADTALALSLAKRAREVLMGLPGLLYLHRFERRMGVTAARTQRRTIL